MGGRKGKRGVRLVLRGERLESKRCKQEGSGGGGGGDCTLEVKLQTIGGRKKQLH